MKSIFYIAAYVLTVVLVACPHLVAQESHAISESQKSVLSTQAELAFYQRIVEAQPSDIDAWYKLGLSHYKLKQYREAVSAYTTALQLDSLHARALFNRGVAYAAAGKNTDAFIDFTACIQRDSSDLEAFLNRAGCYFRAENYEKALFDINVVTERDPSSVGAWALSGAIHAKLGVHDKAVHDYSVCIAYHRDDITSLNARGVSYLHIGMVDSAIQDFSRVRAIDSTYTLAHSNLALAYIQQKDFEKADSEIARLLDELSHESYVWEIAGDYSWKRRKFAESALRYTRSLNLERVPRVFRKRAYSYLSIDSVRLAIKDFTRVLVQDSSDYSIWYNRGLAYLRISRHDRARQDFSQVISLQPKYALAWYYKGMSQARAGNLDAGIASISKAISLDTLHAEFFFNRSMLLLDKQDTLHARSDLQRAIAVNANHVQAMYQLGVLQAMQGDLIDARQHLTACLEVSEGRFVDAFLVRAQVLAELHELADAKKDIASFLSATSDSHPAREQALRLEQELQ